MAKITVTKVTCLRKQELVGKDEIRLKVGGHEVWSDKMSKGDDAAPNVSDTFDNSITVELLERDNNKDRTLDSWSVAATPKGSRTLTATSSGFHYQVDVRVS